MNELNCDKPIEALYIAQYPIDTLESLPDYFLTERTVVNESTGNTKHAITRTPALKLFPQGNMDNVVALAPNNVALEIPEGQVRAGYIQNTGNTAIMQYSDSDHAPMFLMLGMVSDLMLVQNTGFVNMPKGHEFILGMQYYDDGNGVPTTDPSSGRKLFVPVSTTKLAVNM